MNRPGGAGILKAAAACFALVFGAGLVPGPIRVLWVVPRFRLGTVALMEASIVIVATVLAARWIVWRFAAPCRPPPLSVAFGRQYNYRETGCGVGAR